MKPQLRPLSFEFSLYGDDYRIDFYRRHYRIMRKELNVWTGGLLLTEAGLLDDPRTFVRVTIEPSQETHASLVHWAAARAIKQAKKNRAMTRVRAEAFQVFAQDLSCCKRWEQTLKIQIAMGV